jgi:hypothetical protein
VRRLIGSHRSAPGSWSALIGACALVVLAGAPCPIDVDAVECEDDDDCAEHEECVSGACTFAAQSEGEGEGGEGEGEGESPSPAQLAAYCNHLAQCVAEQQGEPFPPDECVAQASAELERTTTDTTCAAYNAALVPLVVCGASAPCETIFDGTFCSPQLAELEEARTSCVALQGSEE